MASPDLIHQPDELDAAIAGSQSQPVFVFKHSLTCPISSAAHRQYLSFIGAQGDASEARFTLIEVQNARPLSREVATRTGIRHESPQAILFHEGEPVWNASHWSITEESLGKALAEVG